MKTTPLACLFVLAFCTAFTACSGGTAGSGTAATSAAASLPSITNFSAAPLAIPPGGSTLLSWNVSGADEISVLPDVGPVTAGSVVVTPLTTTTYTLTARNAHGLTSRTATVTVHGGGAVPHPFYAPLDMRTLPDYGTAAFTYEIPALPHVTRHATIASSGSEAARDLVRECETGNVAVTVPDAAGDIGHVALAGVTDCDVTFGPNVRVRSLVICRRAHSFCFEDDPPPLQPSQRIRIRGGQIGGVGLFHRAADIVLDGVIVNNGVMPSGDRTQTAVNMVEADRVAIVNSLIRMVAVDMGSGIFDGTGFMASNARNVIVANNNMVTAGNRNSWGFRLSGGHNWLILDNTIKVAFHKLIRLNDDDVDYVYVRGGVWMRDGAAAEVLVDSFANIGNGTTTDRIYIHDTAVYLRPAGSQVTFGAGMGGGSQVNRLWEARRIAWYARHAGVVSDAILSQLANSRCGADDVCDYGIGTHSYTYDPDLELPTDAWRSIAGFADPNPERLAVVP